MDPSPHIVALGTQRAPRLRAVLRPALPALIVTLGVVATAWAAVTGFGIVDSSITGRDIRSNSVPGLDVRNGTVSRVDLVPGERAEVFEHINVNNVLLGAVGVDVATRQIPAGRWVIMSGVIIGNPDVTTRTATCSLVHGAPPAIVAEHRITVEPSGRSYLPINTTLQTSSPGPITLQCDGGSVTPTLLGFTGQVIALRTGAVTQSGEWPTN